MLCWILYASFAALPPQAIVDAGADQLLPPGLMTAKLRGSITQRTPLDFWVADGDGATEDYLLKYHEGSGVTAIGPLQSTGGQTFGWPSDFERAAGLVYGIETFHRYLYTLDPATGDCTPIGSASSFTALNGLAYDRGHDILYGVDGKSRKLFKFNRATGKTTVILTLPSSRTDVRGIAFREYDGKVYYTDDATESLYRVDPNTGVDEFLLAYNDGPNAKVDEIDYFYGRLFGSYRTLDPVTLVWSMQLVEIDFEDAVVTGWGPVINDCSAHSLVVNSLPETTRWAQISGPGAATILHPERENTAVGFPRVGAYVFELRAEGVPVTVTDRVTINVLALPLFPPPPLQRKTNR